ncbi:MAG: SRPBCC domain-containing protein [Bacteroidetes bacterium]|nr:SRPBCC domain-containing protein [Bacteroidota bacterium]MCH8033574.1 SRPBCC domain-containing protein [Bacteroidota bacterium]
MPSIKHYLVIKAVAEKVYTALSKTEGLCGWWTVEAKADERVGGTAEFIFGERYYNKMKITNLLNSKKVEWKCLEGDKEWIGTTFLFDLEEKDESTILRFSHNNWKEETDFFASCNYNWGYYLKSLKQYCETGEGTPFNNG